MANRKLQDAMPLAPLKIVAMGGCSEIGKRVNEIIIARRKEALAASNKPDFMTSDYSIDNYLVDFECLRFGTGEGRAVVNESIRGSDLFIISDTVNYHETYDMHGNKTHMSPDDHFMDLKRVIMACSGHPRRITVIMPYLYEGRQHVRLINESLDCAQAMQELIRMGVETIITFDAHDNRVQNAIPNNGFDNFFTSYQFISTILNDMPDLIVDNEHLMTISPDEGGMRRAVFYSNQLGVDMGMFYKRRDYSTIVNGKNPIVAHEFLGDSVEGKDVVVIDDMISSGGSMLDVAKQLKERNAKRVFVCTTYGLFTDGLDKFDEYYEKAVIDFESIQVALYHIVENAAKYIKPQTILKVLLSNDDKFHTIEFKMNSLHLYPDDIKQMFNEGYSGINAKKTSKAGDGIGMYRVKRLIELNKSEIHVVAGDEIVTYKGYEYSDNSFIIKIPVV